LYGDDYGLGGIGELDAPGFERLMDMQVNGLLKI
jgi:hypothetical protein